MGRKSRGAATESKMSASITKLGKKNFFFSRLFGNLGDLLKLAEYFFENEADSISPLIPISTAITAVHFPPPHVRKIT